jgi:hypothetical protein
MPGHFHLKSSILIILLSLTFVVSAKKGSSKTSTTTAGGKQTTPAPEAQGPEPITKEPEGEEEEELVEEKITININGSIGVKCDPRKYVQRGYIYPFLFKLLNLN